MKPTTLALVIASLAIAGCTSPDQGGPVQVNRMNIIAGGVGQDIPARVYEEYGMDTTCSPGNVNHEHSTGDSDPYPCPDDQGYPHIGRVCSQMKWSVQFRNDHPTDTSEEKYGLPYDAKLVASLQEWRANHQELRFYWVRYSDTGCKFSDNEVIYCVELTNLDLADSADHGCIKAMHRTFPGLDTSWRQGFDFATPNDGVADATANATAEGSA